jgi:uncharacterized protein (TIGR00730 family)
MPTREKQKRISRKARPVRDPARFGPRAADEADDTLLAVRIFQETLKGMEFLRGAEPAVTMFGSARIAPTHRFYKMARATAAAFARAGYSVITGGGPGLMEASNRGARDAGGRSIGCNITLPFEQQPNPYLDSYMEFEFFHVRKHMLRKASSAIILLPGGLGTLDEIFEALTLMQTSKSRVVPVIAMGTDFWKHLGPFMQDTMLAHSTISRGDLCLYTATDDPAEAVAIVRGVARAGHRAAAVKRIIRAHRARHGLPV